jgi:hypothetical protein
MGALPKNKITRAERGKRRAGNTPSLKSDVKVVTIPRHKRGLAASILSKLGFSSEQVTREVHKKRKTGDQQNLSALNERNISSAHSMGKASNKHRAQHKG